MHPTTVTGERKGSGGVRLSVGPPLRCGLVVRMRAVYAVQYQTNGYDPNRPDRRGGRVGEAGPRSVQRQHDQRRITVGSRLSDTRRRLCSSHGPAIMHPRGTPPECLICSTLGLLYVSPRPPHVQSSRAVHGDGQRSPLRCDPSVTYL